MTLLFTTFLVAVRLMAMSIIAPVLGNVSVPLYVRTALAITIAIAVSPLVLEEGANLNLFDGSTDWVSIVATEAMIGGAIGLGILIIFSTAQMIGAIISQMAGIQLDSITPNMAFGKQPVSQLIGVVASATFVLSGGIELLFSSVVDSFIAAPIGNVIGPETMTSILTILLQQSFELTIRAVAPAITTLLISTIVVGFLSRTLPQLNLIQVGLSSNFGLMLIALFLTLGGCVWLIIDDIDQTTTFINKTLAAIR